MTGQLVLGFEQTINEFTQASLFVGRRQKTDDAQARRIAKCAKGFLYGYLYYLHSCIIIQLFYNNKPREGDAGHTIDDPACS